MISGERVRLRAAEREDISRFVTWLNDPEVRSGLSIYLPFSRVEEEQWFENMLRSPKEEHTLVIEIRETDGWTAIGNCSLFQIHWKNRNAELGISIGEKRCWNQGYGTEVVRLLLRHGFHTLNLNRIYLRVFESNPRAIRSYEKAGFTHEGRMRQAEFQEGQYVDVLLMSVLRSEWIE